MAALDFPASPTNGQIFVAPNGVTYQWTGTLWLPIGATQALYVGDTPPASPGQNQLWWNSASGQMYLWYNDGSSTQWVPAMPTLPVGVPAPVVWRQIASVTPVVQPAVDVQNIPADINHLKINFDLSPTGNDVDLVLQLYDGAGVLDTATGRYGWNTMTAYSSATASAPPVQTNQGSGTVTTGIALDYAVASGRVGNQAGNSISGWVKIPNIRDTTKWKKTTSFSTYVVSSGLYLASNPGGGYRAVAGAMTGFRLSFNGGSNIAAGGNVTVWGSP